jgi:tetratricopeptide (TPR) repeat protein
MLSPKYRAPTPQFAGLCYLSLRRTTLESFFKIFDKHFMRFILPILITTLLCCSANLSHAGDDDQIIRALEKDILTKRLEGNYPQALALCAKLKAIPAGETLGIALELDTQLTALSWDDQKVFSTQDMIRQTNRLIKECKPKRKKPTADQLFLCGRGHFARAYLSAMEGKFYAAGTHGSDAIDAFEAALDQDPGLTDVKLPLGMAYFYADHLPAIVKLMAPLLWFIPTGNSDKSLPYIQEVMATDGAYADAARFIYSDLITQQAPELMPDAIQTLQGLTERYPMNPRLHLALIGSYAYSDQWRAAYDAIGPLRLNADPNSAFQSIGHIWAVYSLKYLKQPIPQDVEKAFLIIGPEDIPGWAIDWFTLAQGLVLDFQQNRSGAIEKYQTVLESENNFNSGWLLELAKTGLNEPLFTLAPEG